MDISKPTRKNLLDWLAVEHVRWQGRLDDVQFLGRIFDLDAMPSQDHRFLTATQDISQHTIYNDDWQPDWVFHDSRFDLMKCADDVLLLFLAEMLHPLVRENPAESDHLASVFNDLLRDDGFELVVGTRIGRRPVWIGRRRSLRGGAAMPALRDARTKFDADYVLQQITRMEAAVEADPSLAIGTAKELLETTCKGILEARGQRSKGNEDLPHLVRLVSEALDLLPDRANKSKDPATMRKVLGSLGTLASGIAELRNSYGTGHGQSPGTRGLAARHAKLAVGAAATLAVFLYETHEERPPEQTGSGE